MLGPVLEITNAFFGAFFGFWLSNYMNVLQSTKCGALETAFFLIALLLSLSLNIVGFASVLRLGEDSLARDFVKKSLISIVALAFFALPVGIAACYYASVVFISAVGIIIYIWWVGVLFIAVAFRG